MESLTLTLFMSIVHGLSESCVFHSCIFHSRIFSAPRQTQLSTTLWGRRLRLFGHIARAGSRMDHTLAFRSIISGRPRDCKRPPGRPWRTWLRIRLNRTCGRLTSAWCQLGNGLRIVYGGSGQWKRLSSRLGHALDDDIFYKPIGYISHRLLQLAIVDTSWPLRRLIPRSADNASVRLVNRCYRRLRL